MARHTVGKTVAQWFSAEARQSGQTMPGSVSESGQLQNGQFRGQTMSKARRHQSLKAPGRERFRACSGTATQPIPAARRARATTGCPQHSDPPPASARIRWPGPSPRAIRWTGIMPSSTHKPIPKSAGQKQCHESHQDIPFADRPRDNATETCNPLLQVTCSAGIITRLGLTKCRAE